LTAPEASFVHVTARPTARACRAASLCLAVACLPLAACLQTLPNPVCPPSAQTAQGSVRVMVGFQQAVQGASPQVLEQLQRHAGACVTYLSSVSPSVHVYQFSGVTDPAALDTKLRAWSQVQQVVPDNKVRSH
jgi:hypothetical protein